MGGAPRPAQEHNGRPGQNAPGRFLGQKKGRARLPARAASGTAKQRRLLSGSAEQTPIRKKRRQTAGFIRDH